MPMLYSIYPQHIAPILCGWHDILIIDMISFGFFQWPVLSKACKAGRCFSAKKASNQPISKLETLLKVSTPRSYRFWIEIRHRLKAYSWNPQTHFIQAWHRNSKFEIRKILLEIVRPFNRSQRERYQAHRGADDVCFSIHIFMSCFGAGKGVNSKGYKVKTKPTLLPSVCRGWGRTMWREWGF